MNLRFHLFVSGVNQGKLMSKEGEPKISFCYRRCLGASRQSFRERGGVI